MAGRRADWLTGAVKIFLQCGASLAKARRDCSRDVAGGGGEREDVRPLVVFGPPRPARVKTPAEATETLTEDTNFVRRPTKKHVRAVGTPLTIWARQKKQGPCDYQGPFQLSGALWLSGTLPTVRDL